MILLYKEVYKYSCIFIYITIIKGKKGKMLCITEGNDTFIKDIVY